MVKTIKEAILHYFKIIKEDTVRLVLPKHESVDFEISTEKPLVDCPKELEEHLDTLMCGYGFASSDWAGIGVYFYDAKDNIVVWFENDMAYSTDDEIIYNDFLKMNILDSMGLLEEKDTNELYS